MTKPSTTFIICFYWLAGFGQNDSVKAIYSQLDTVKYYHQRRGDSGMENCKPCVYQTYSTAGVLIQEGIMYTDCAVGQVINYYPNGKIESTQQYKENDTGDWSRIFERGYCWKAHGAWIYYDKDERITKVEKYVDGALIE